MGLPPWNKGQLKMFADIAAKVIEAILGAVLRKIVGWLDARAEQKQGAVAQASRDTAAAEKTESAMAQAEADAPKSNDEALKRLRDGTA